MKVLGQLESAQLENLSADPTPASLGRVYLNISNPASPQPRIYTTSGWRNLSMGQATATIVQNSGKAVTVNWAQGLTQQVVLTDNCLISFSNPVEGGIHTLLVTQATTIANSNAPYVYKLADSGIDNQNDPYQVSGILIPFGGDRMHRWLYKLGARPAFNTAPGFPTAGITPFLPGAPIGAIAVHPMQQAVIGSKTATPFTYFNYLKSKMPNNTGPLVAYAGVTSVLAPNGQPNQSEISPDGEVYGCSSQVSPFAFSSYIGQAPTNGQYPTTQFSGPSALSGATFQCTWHPSSQFVALSGNTSPFMYVFNHTRVGWGTQVTNPATLPAAAAFGMAFSPFGDYLAVSFNASPYIHVYPFNTASGGSFGAKIANPSTLPVGGTQSTAGKQVAWRPQGDFIAMVQNNTPYLYVVPFDRVNGSFGTPLSITGSAIPGGMPNSIQWSPDGQYLVLGGAALTIYDFSSLTIGAPVSWTGIPVSITDLCFDPNGEWLYFSSGTTPFLGALKMPTKVRSYVRYL